MKFSFFFFELARYGSLDKHRDVTYNANITQRNQANGMYRHNFKRTLQKMSWSRRVGLWLKHTNFRGCNFDFLIFSTLAYWCFRANWCCTWAFECDFRSFWHVFIHLGVFCHEKRPGKTFFVLLLAIYCSVAMRLKLSQWLFGHQCFSWRITKPF